MPLMLRAGGVHELGQTTCGISKGCQLSGALFVGAMDPIGRRIHAMAPIVRCMFRHCADDTLAFVRRVSLASWSWCLRMPEALPERCEVVSVGLSAGRDSMRLSGGKDFGPPQMRGGAFRVKDCGGYVLGRNFLGAGAQMHSRRFHLRSGGVVQLPSR